MVDDCIFCKIIAGDIPSSKVYEDEEVLAFLDISQVTPGHTLVVPKKHARNLLEMDETATAQLFARVSKVAKKVEAATQAKGMNIISNMEEVSGQTVFHTHVHIIPRYSDRSLLVKNKASFQMTLNQVSNLALERSNWLI